VPEVVRDSNKLKQALITRLNQRLRLSGEVIFPCVPSLLDLYVRRLSLMWASIGKPFDRDEIAEVQRLMKPWLDQGFSESPHNRVKVSWQSDSPPSAAVNYQIELLRETVDEQYEYWVATKTPPLFGAHPDARAMDVAATLPAGSRVADLGAGTGRNSLPLGRAGYRVDAVEVTRSFVDIVNEAAAAAGLSDVVVAHHGDALPQEETLPVGEYGMVLLSEVVTHFRGLADLRAMFVRADRLLSPGGYLVFNGFVADDDYELDVVARELSQIHWSWIVVRDELDAASMELPFSLVSDDVVYDYEQARQPEWPPTGWFESWSRVRDVFAMTRDEVPPVSLRWLVYQKRAVAR
jgi:2-polyprenyl-3-methyl-5-hydroxy-6-metoxy-1,4-benzoquinol methylase